VREAESEALKAHLDRRPIASSAIATVEVTRAVRLVADTVDARASVEATLREVTLVRMSDRILMRARDLRPPLLRSLDAIHLATALEVEAPEMLVYDRRLGDAARAHGLAVVSPGA
jgi:uncharacterized protein